MNLFPRDIIVHELLPRLSPSQFVDYCGIDKISLRHCQSPDFWTLKIRSLSHRELHDEWWDFFAKNRKFTLLSKLYDAATKEGYIIDNRLICYTALYLMENEEQLTGSALTLLGLFKARVEKNGLLTGAGVESFCGFSKKLKYRVAKLRKSIVKNNDKFIKYSNSLLSDSYLGEYICDYLYRHLRDVLPELTVYIGAIDAILLQKTKTPPSLDFIEALIRGMMINKEVAKVKIFFDSFKTTKFAQYPYGRQYYDRAFGYVLSVSSLSDVRLIDGSQPLWKNPHEYPIPIPIDRNVFFEIHRSSKYSTITLTMAYRALEPEEYIEYLNNLEADGRITNENKNNTIALIIIKTQLAGYSYFAAKLQNALNEITRINIAYWMCDPLNHGI